MAMRPTWLPNIISMDGTWEKTLANLYAIFEHDFINGKPYFNDKPVWWDTRTIDDQYEEGFWHIISTTDPETSERIPDFERARRLPWCAPTIVHNNDAAVKCWDFKEASRKIRTYLWLEQWDYLVILEKRKTRTGEAAFLITAYTIGGSSTRKKLTQKYNQRIQNA